MEIDFRTRVEIETLTEVLDELDYYKIMKLKGGAPVPDVEKAYAAQSKNFHPDRFFGVRDPKFTKAVNAIFKKLNEAYQVLRDPDLKKMYDKKMGFRDAAGKKKTGGGDRKSRPSIDKEGLEQEQGYLDADEVVTDKKAKKYWDLAQIAEMNEDWNGVVMNLQFALNYEQGNPVLKSKLETAKVYLADKKKKNKNPYKIKIV
ncbi:MAG TPA: hypothetical protein DIU15_13565 [Deltaproteobacteria bacterium]|nr:hypothetical protein [Deltaproteobacteria bacterium]